MQSVEFLNTIQEQVKYYTHSETDNYFDIQRIINKIEDERKANEDKTEHGFEYITDWIKIKFFFKDCWRLFDALKDFMENETKDIFDENDMRMENKKRQTILKKKYQILNIRSLLEERDYVNLTVASSFGQVIGEVQFWIKSYTPEDNKFKDKLLYKLGKLYDRREKDVYSTTKKFSKEMQKLYYQILNNEILQYSSHNDE